MPNLPPSTEVIPNQPSPAELNIPFYQEPAWYRSHRFLIFIFVFALCLIPSLLYVFLRPPIYQSSATLLTVAPTPIDQRSAEADIQHVAIQGQLLRGQPLLRETIKKLEEAGQPSTNPSLTVADIQNMLTVVAVPDTNLVELQAEGPQAEILPLIINTWIDTYLEMRSQEIKKATDSINKALQEEFQGLEQKITKKRQELAQFRQEHDILSMGREENQALARLNGLTESLNQANEEAVKAKARLDAIKTAIARGEAVVPSQEKASLVNLEQRAQQLRERLAELDRRYTREYLALQPSLRVIPEQLKEVENKIRNKVEHGQKIVLTEAKQAYAAARQTVQEIQKQLDAHKRKVSEFTARFSEHEALQEELKQLEELYRETEKRLVQIEVKQQEKYPQFDVIEWAYLSRDPVRPFYLRDTAIAISSALLLGLLAVWLSEFLTRGEKQTSSLTLSGVHMYTGPHVPELPKTVSAGQLKQQSTAALESPFPRELSKPEIRALLNAADLKTQQLIAALLSGLTLEEAAALKAEHIDFDSNELSVSSNTARTLPLSPLFKHLLLKSDPIPLWQTQSPDKVEDLAALITCVAIDSGLSHPDEISPQSLCHTYIAYLVRQGLRLSDLEQVVGKLSPPLLAAYGQFSPTGPGKPMNHIELVYPSLKKI